MRPKSLKLRLNIPPLQRKNFWVPFKAHEIEARDGTKYGKQTSGHPGGQIPTVHA